MRITNASATIRSTLEQIWSWLGNVTDPEVPALSIVDLGIVREVAWSGENGDECVITITPTYSGCPATAVIQQNIREELEKHGLRARLQVCLSPPWTTDWLSSQAAEKLHAFGIAPPAAHAVGPGETPSGLPILESGSGKPQTQPVCPRCGSARTTLISQFGSTLCKALYRCEECLEPFESFKRH